MPAATVRILLGSLALLSWLPSAAEPQPLRHRQLFRVPIDEPVLALAFVGDGRILSLAADSLSLWRLEDDGARRVARATWPRGSAVVRHGGGLIVGRSDESAAWLLSSYAEGAQLVRVDGPRLVLGDVAAAAPWPSAPEGLRFRPGTNLVDGVGSDAGAFAIVALDTASHAVVREDGMLILEAGETQLRVGSAIASLWPDALLASGAGPPGAADALSLLRRAGAAWERVWSVALPGDVTAVAARSGARAADVVVALRSAAGPELMRLELRPAP